MPLINYALRGLGACGVDVVVLAVNDLAEVFMGYLGGRVYRLGYTSDLDEGSGWAEMVREGHQILWVIRGGGYLAQVRDGEFHDFRE